MRALVFSLALLAAAKVGYQEYLFRVSASDAIISAYRERAMQACQRDAGGLELGISPLSWSNPASIQLVIGKSGLGVYLWQVDHVLWSARYRNPYLHLSAGQRSGSASCEYDIVNAAASVRRM
jgi:hypothetical protein